MKKQKKAYVLGAGPLGLSVAFELYKNNYKVTILDSNKQIGGLAQSLNFNGDTIDLFYHFYYWGDEKAATNFLSELSREVNISWRDISTENYVCGSFVNFDSLKSILKLSRSDFFKLFWTLVKVKFFPISKKLDKISAYEWASNSFGINFFNNVWRTLLDNKFGKHASLVSAFWLASRIKRHLSTKIGSGGRCRFGYLISTYQPFFDILEKKIVDNGGKFLMNQRIKEIIVKNGKVKKIVTNNSSIEIEDDAPVFSTFPLGSLKEIKGISKSLPYLNSFNLVGAVVVILKLSKPLSSSYWTTVSDATIPFDVLIQQNRLYSNASCEIVYLSRYFDQADSFFTKNKRVIKNLFLDGLYKMYPKLKKSDILDSVVIRTKKAAPIPFINMLDKLPNYKSQIINL